MSETVIMEILISYKCDFSISPGKYFYADLDQSLKYFTLS